MTLSAPGIAGRRRMPGVAVAWDVHFVRREEHGRQHRGRRCSSMDAGRRSTPRKISRRARRAAAAGCARRRSAPPPFPAVPLGTTVAISERAAVAALTLVPGLQKRQYALVPRRLDEKAFWVNFFSHATCLLAPKK